MKKYISILFIFLYSFALAQDVYPNFSDALKQLKFEENRIYILEDSGEERITTGGGSYTEIANPIGYILGVENAQYVAKSLPVDTYYKYWYEFKIKQGTDELNEMEFIKLIGLIEKYDYIKNKRLKMLEEYNAALENHKNSSYVGQGIVGYKKRINSWIPFLVGSGLLLVQNESGRVIEEVRIPAMLIFTFWVFNLFSKEKPIYGDVILYGLNQPIKPEFKQILSNEQIKSLAESYNRQVYKEIQSQP